DGTVELHGAVRNEIAGRDYRVVLACVGGAGNPGAAAVAASLIARHAPRTLLLMGIALANREGSSVSVTKFSWIIRAGHSHAVSRKSWRMPPPALLISDRAARPPRSRPRASAHPRARTGRGRPRRPSRCGRRGAPWLGRERRRRRARCSRRCGARS